MPRYRHTLLRKRSIKTVLLCCIAFATTQDSEMCRAHAKFWNSVTVQDKSTEDVHAPKNLQYVGLSWSTKWGNQDTTIKENAYCLMFNQFILPLYQIPQGVSSQQLLPSGYTTAILMETWAWPNTQWKKVNLSLKSHAWRLQFSTGPSLRCSSVSTPHFQRKTVLFPFPEP